MINRKKLTPVIILIALLLLTSCRPAKSTTDEQTAKIKSENLAFDWQYQDKQGATFDLLKVAAPYNGGSLNFTLSGLVAPQWAELYLEGHPKIKFTTEQTQEPNFSWQIEANEPLKSSDESPFSEGEHQF